MNTEKPVERSSERRSGLFWGVVMVVIGIALLSSQFFDLGNFWGQFAIYFMPFLGLIFLGWGIFQREAGFIIPGGILSGLGTGVVLTAGGIGAAPGVDTGGIFMLSFALGFALITVLTAFFTDETHWWPLIPGSIMALVGLTVLYGGVFEQALTLLGMLWPIALIAGGVYLIYRVSRRGKTVG